MNVRGLADPHKSFSILYHDRSEAKPLSDSHEFHELKFVEFVAKSFPWSPCKIPWLILRPGLVLLIPVKEKNSDMHRQSGGKIVKKVWINASTKVIYGALTDPRELVHWFCDRASCDPREGGEFTAYWRTDKLKGRGAFVRVLPGSTLELLWTDDGKGVRNQNSPHTLSYEIRSKSGMCEVVMTDQEIPAPEEETVSLRDQAWTSVLQELKDHCERRERAEKIRPRSRTAAQGSRPE